MERVGILVHPTRPVLEAVEILQQWSLERGFELVQIPSGEQPVVAPAGEVGRCDLIVALGGDGTILKALHASARTRTPVLGVAYGSLGALTTIPTSELLARWLWKRLLPKLPTLTRVTVFETCDARCEYEGG